jgi:hypothetical protein
MMTAPQLGEMDYNDIGRLQQVGARTRELRTWQNYKMLLLDMIIEQQKPYIKLNQYLGALGASVPSNTSRNFTCI